MANQAFPTPADIRKIPEFTVKEVEAIASKADHVDSIYRTIRHEAAKERCRQFNRYLPHIKQGIHDDIVQFVRQSNEESSLLSRCGTKFMNGIYKSVDALIPNSVTSPVVAGLGVFALTSLVLHELVYSKEPKLADSVLPGLCMGAFAAITVGFRGNPYGPLSQ